MPSKTLTIILSLALVLVWDVEYGKTQAKDSATSDPDRKYLLPRYPSGLRNADLELELILEWKGLEEINVISCNETDSETGNINAFCRDSVANIRYAVKQWHFPEGLRTWKLKVSFCYMPTTDEESNPAYYVYYADGERLTINVSSVNEVSAFASKIPKEIMVEFHIRFNKNRDGIGL
jgi:hypothetical protein